MADDSNRDLEGNIKLDTFDQQSADVEEAKNNYGFQPETNESRPSSAASSNISERNGDVLSTLDEPVSETIKRDLTRIWEKLRIVINPIAKVDTEEKRKEIRNWDLWGPFFFCLMLATVLSIATKADDKTLLFEIVFCIVWLGGAVIAVNGQLLGGTISFFQSICLLGYCLFPLNVAAIINLIIGSYVHIVVKLIYVIIAFVWSTMCK